jgi:hypothetical protein
VLKHLPPETRVPGIMHTLFRGRALYLVRVIGAFILEVPEHTALDLMPSLTDNRNPSARPID